MNPSGPSFLDTNILLYAASNEPAEAEKHRRALAILSDRDCVLSVQVLQEFYVQATRPTRADAMAHDDAVGFIRTWGRFPIQPMTTAVLTEALRLKPILRYAYWDCAVIAAARAMTCRTLYTEDMSHGQVIDGMTVINPFL